MSNLFIDNAFSFPALAIYNSCAGLFRSMSKTSVIMYVSIIMNIINIIGNAIGIFILHAGVAGVAYPSLISRVVAALILLIISFNQKNIIYIRIKDIFKWNAQMIKRILNIAIPNGIENGLFQLSKVALSSIVAMFGTSQIEEIKQLKKLPIFFIYSRDDDVVAPETHELPTIRRLLGAGASNVHTFVSKHVIDTSGRFNDKDGEPLRYSGHWSWIYFFNNEAVSDRCGIRVWQWMAQQLK